MVTSATPAPSGLPETSVVSTPSPLLPGVWEANWLVPPIPELDLQDLCLEEVEGQELEEMWSSICIFITLFLLSVSYGATVTVLKVGSCTSAGGPGRARPSRRAILTYTFPPGEVGLLHTDAGYTPGLPRLCQHPPDQGIGNASTHTGRQPFVLSLLRCLLALDDSRDQRPPKGARVDEISASRKLQLQAQNVLHRYCETRLKRTPVPHQFDLPDAGHLGSSQVYGHWGHHYILPE